MLSKNLPVKDRVNAVNAMLLNYAGERRLFLDRRCRELANDLEQVIWKSDPHGNVLSDLDKSDPMRTHLSYALGYYGHERGGPSERWIGQVRAADHPEKDKNKKPGGLPLGADESNKVAAA